MASRRPFSRLAAYRLGRSLTHINVSYTWQTWLYGDRASLVYNGRALAAASHASFRSSSAEANLWSFPLFSEPLISSLLVGVLMLAKRPQLTVLAKLSRPVPMLKRKECSAFISTAPLDQALLRTAKVLRPLPALFWWHEQIDSGAFALSCRIRYCP